MRISDLRIDGFGVWNGLELGELSDQLNVLYGPNEAGKTTLLEFVRSVLYGFSAERVARYFPPVHGGAPGGSLRVSHGQQTLVLRRYVSDGQENWSIVPLGRAETADDDLSLSALLGDVDETIFNNVFAVGLREIQELAGLSGTQAASELYSLALGLDRVSLVEVLADLDVSRDRLLAADGRPSVVPQLLAERERLQEELGELGQATRRYLSLRARFARRGGCQTRARAANPPGTHARAVVSACAERPLGAPRGPRRAARSTAKIRQLAARRAGAIRSTAREMAAYSAKSAKRAQAPGAIARAGERFGCQRRSVRTSAAVRGAG